MPTLQGRTRLQIEVSVLHNLGAVRELTASGAGSTSTFVTNQIPLGATNDHLGKWLHHTSGANNSGQLRRVTASAVSSNVTTLTYLPTTTDAPGASGTALLIGWQNDELHPQRIHEFINQAITEITGEYYDPEESVALFCDGKQARIDIPAEFSMLKRVFYRSYVPSVVIHTCDSDWDEQTVLSNVTRTVDTEDRKQGSGAIRFAFAAAASTGIVSSKAITSLDLRRYTHLEAWVKCTVATAAGDFRILLDDTASVASVLENLQVPALVADTWTYVRLAFDAPELLSAVISVGLRQQVDVGACTFWIDDVKAVRDDDAIWEELDRGSWRVDKEARDLILKKPGRVGYALLKLEGGDEPALPTADSDVVEVPEEYLIQRVTAMALFAGLATPGMDGQQRMIQAQMWASLAEKSRAKHTNMTNVRPMSTT